MMKTVIAAAIAALFAAVTFTAAAQAPAPSGAPSADAPKAEKKASKAKKAKKSKKSSKSGDSAPAADEVIVVDGRQQKRTRVRFFHVCGTLRACARRESTSKSRSVMPLSTDGAITR